MENIISIIDNKNSIKVAKTLDIEMPSDLLFIGSEQAG